jgi:hypothetical protein
MPQGPIPVANTNLIPQGAKNTPNITTATLVKGTPGTLLSVAVITAGSAPGTINDVATVGGVATANQIGTIPTSVGVTEFKFPFTNGLVITPGIGGQVVSVSWI